MFDGLLFDYQYTITAFFSTIVLLILFYLRRSYSSQSNRIFTNLIYANLITSALDLLTFFTISFPQNYTPLTRDFVNILYLILSGVFPATFLRYICTLIGDRRYIIASRITYTFYITFETIMISTSPLTRLITYFDEINGQIVYCHGPLFVGLTAFPALLLAVSILLFIRRRSQFSPYQRVTMVTIFLIAMLLAACQITNSRLDIIHIIYTGSLYALYIVFENPAGFTYHATRCLNDKAFYQEATVLSRHKSNCRMLLMCLNNHPRDHSIQEAFFLRSLYDHTAEELHRLFKRRVFCVAPGKFIIILQVDENENETIAQICARIAMPFTQQDHSVIPDIRTTTFFLDSVAYQDDYIDHLIESIAQAAPEELCAPNGLNRVIHEQHQFRDMEDLLHESLKRDAFTLHYQPIFDIKSGRYLTAEVLLRLNGPDGKPVSPSDFIPVAEKNNSIIPIGQLVFEKACALCARVDLQALGLHILEINLSAIQLTQEGMADTYIDIMKRSGVDPHFINFEITESAAMISNRIFTANVNALVAAGVSFSIDDFGTGFSSSDTLFKLPISVVKVDRSLLQDAVKNKNAMIVFNGVMSMIKRLDKEIVVEGAESSDMVQLICDNNADYIQGFYYSHPLPEEAFIRFLKEKNAA